MGYSIHIERQAASGERVPIVLAEWTAAVAAVAGLRLRQDDTHAVNPQTGERLTIANSGGDVDIADPDSGEWLPAFFWSPRGSASFTAFEDADPMDAAVRAAARALAQRLGAVLLGDEGEGYG